VYNALAVYWMIMSNFAYYTGNIIWGEFDDAFTHIAMLLLTPNHLALLYH
jgi:hypothetical protein